MKHVWTLLVLGTLSNVTWANECSFSKIIDLEREYCNVNGACNDIKDSFKEALLENGFIEDAQSPNIAYVRESSRQTVGSFLNPVTLPVRILENIEERRQGKEMQTLGGPRDFKFTRIIEIKNEQNNVVGKLKQTYVSDQMDFHNGTNYDLLKMDCK